MKTALATLAAAALLAGCASGSAKIEPAQVPATTYANLTCSQMRAEAIELKAEAQRLGIAQDKKAEKDAVLMATSMLIFAPAAIGISGNGETAASLSVVKGQAYALQAAAKAKGCA